MSEQSFVQEVEQFEDDLETAVSVDPTDAEFRPWVKRYRGEFQTPFPPKSRYLYGHIEASIYDSGVAPNTIIKVGDDWYVDIYWSMKGMLMPLVYGKWCVRLHMESMGRGKEFNFPHNGHEVYVKVDPCGNGLYHYRLKVPAGTVKAKHCGIPYKLVVSVTFHDVCGRPGYLTGVVEGPILHFYNEHRGHNGHPYAAADQSNASLTAPSDE